MHQAHVLADDSICDMLGRVAHECAPVPTIYSLPFMLVLFRQSVWSANLGLPQELDVSSLHVEEMPLKIRQRVGDGCVQS